MRVLFRDPLRAKTKSADGAELHFPPITKLVAMAALDTAFSTKNRM
jgi:hypothetical protein